MKPAVRPYEWRRAGLVAILTVAGVVFPGVLASEVLDWELSLALRDPLAVAHAGDDVYAIQVGWASNAGIVCWGIASGAALLAGRVCLTLRRHAQASFLMASGGLSLLLMVDDLYQLHETVVPRLWGPQDALLAVLGAFTLAYLWGFRHRLLGEPDLPILVLAFSWFGSSLALEMLEVGGIWEDVCKLLGILSWTVFHVRVATKVILAPR